MPPYIYIPVTGKRTLSVFEMNPQSGKLSRCQEIELSSQPWQICVAPTHQYLYQSIRGDGYSGVVTFKKALPGGHLTQIGEIELDADACYITTDKTGRFLLCAYLIPGMVTVHSIGDDGTVKPLAVDTQTTEIYAHYISTDHSNKFAFVPHVAPTDTIYQFQFNDETGKLTPNRTRKLDTKRGQGPRHLSFNPNLNIVYGNAEQASMITVYTLDASNGTLQILQNLPTIPNEGFDGKNSTGTVKVNPNGNTVYISNRGHDSIAIFSASPTTGLLSSIGQTRSEKCPRTFAIDPNGNFLFAAGDHSGRLTSYRINASGLLKPLEHYMVGVLPSWVLPI